MGGGGEDGGPPTMEQEMATTLQGRSPRSSLKFSRGESFMELEADQDAYLAEVSEKLREAKKRRRSWLACF